MLLAHLGYCGDKREDLGGKVLGKSQEYVQMLRIVTEWLGGISLTLCNSAQLRRAVPCAWWFQSESPVGD